MVAIGLTVTASVASVASAVRGSTVLQIESRYLDEGTEGMTWVILFGFLRNKLKIGFLALIIYAALC